MERCGAGRGARVVDRRQPRAGMTRNAIGATGDLTRRKLVPALYSLARAGHLPREVSVIGFARSQGDDASIREALRTGVAEYSRTGFDPATWDSFAADLTYLRADYADPEG